MLNSIKITNFKSIDSQIELSFEPTKDKENKLYLTKDNSLKIVFIYGANASGKTNIIKAIEFLRDFILNAPKKKDTHINIVPFKFKEKTDNTSSFELDFKENNYNFKYKLSLNEQKVVSESLYYKKSRKYAKVFLRQDDKIEWGTTVKIKKLESDTIKINTLPNISVLSAYLRLNIDIDIIDTVLKFFNKILPPIYPYSNLLYFVINRLNSGEVEKTDIIKILQNADFAIDDFDIEEEDIDSEIIKILEFLEEESNSYKKIELIFRHYNRYKLNFEEESRGTQRFYQLAVFLALLSKGSYILSIDEIENSLHPDILKFFILIFLSNSNNSQIIVTTHDRELLKEKEILIKDMIWFCQKREDGSTELYPLSDFKTDSNEAVYEYYKRGKVGAIPNIKNYIRLFDE